ncbi:MAG: MlaE family lipid ABC transporter permease subunit [Nitrospira sp.]|nr:MlaE family lipid ABC transporter permease subunit [Nitrospira sp.]MDH4368487.1 MlaE family lipid ABC transporter permease subunit [Nitrospira sp.]MDH5346369.1 MlaE family lipid ABC transporter permease subunit [Nitrospira sp.]MDH5496121.1 MlaE family lipid ABC transporter permease subunit [Nitrospira sp.]MDH5724372.1 MlaE family lipid ABC transporter permease subunit [Nitrospira sp.]
MEQQATISIEDNIIRCRGAWVLSNLTQLERGSRALRWPDESPVLCDAGGVTAMDTGGAIVLQRCIDTLRRKGQQMSLEGLRPEFEELLRKIEAQWPQSEHGSAIRRGGWTDSLAQAVQSRQVSILRALAFLGESTIALGRSLIRPRSIRWRTLLRFVELDGLRALPITGLLTFLVGVVIAYQGAEQLRKFGTNIFIVDLVGISLLREIAPLIVAILIAGRSGSAYAAEIGTMKVTEELDAVRTLGISPMNLLVLPRALALVIALPLLTVYADVVGVFGGMLIALGELNVSFAEFIARFEEAVPVRHFLIGLGKAPFFAAIIALVGCYQGFQIRGGVDDVGRHTTISVVQGIFFVIVFDAVCSILLNWWDL